MQQVLVFYKDVFFGLVIIFFFFGRIWDKDCVTNFVGGYRSLGRFKVYQGVIDEGVEIVFFIFFRKMVCFFNFGVKVFQIESVKK